MLGLFSPKKPFFKIIVIFIGLLLSFYWATQKADLNPFHDIGDKVDSLNGVYVYYNGGVGNVEERNTHDGYNLGLEYQCVEFVKRYYYEYYDHKMPDSYGHARDFFNESLKDGSVNKKRELLQFTNPSSVKPRVGDLIVLGPSFFNRYGHVAIIAVVSEEDIEIIQQNPGPFGGSRDHYKLLKEAGKWEIEHDRVLGFLRK